MIRTLAAALATPSCLVAFASPAAAQTREFNIPAGSLRAALDTFARQSGRQVIYRGDEVQSRRSPGVRGPLTAEEALDAILAGTGFRAQKDSSGAFAVAKVGNGADSDRSASPREGPLSSAEPAATENTDIVVTGSNIRGVAPSSSPISQYTRTEIERTGAATVADFMRTVPSNFSGGSNASLPNGTPSDFNSTENFGQGSGANLRGLGSGATLVLLNGHRVAPSSGIGDFVDLSMIPLSAVERVDVLKDGASSIYGGDAVAGVVNYVLRRDFDGAETSVRYGSVTNGEMQEWRFNQTFGKSWDTGAALITYEHYKTDPLNAADRSFSKNQLLPNDLLAGQNTDSVFASINQAVGDSLTLSADGLFSDRKTRQTITNYQDPDTGDKNTTGSLAKGRQYVINGRATLRLSPSWTIDAGPSYSSSEISNSESAFPDAFRHGRSSQFSIDGKASGSLFALPGGDVRLALGGEYRREKLSFAGPGTVRDASRSVWAGYGEVFIPVVGASNEVPFIHRLELNLSGRYDNYSDFGGTFNPKVGVAWAPVEGLKLRGSYATSFRPPELGRVGSIDYRADVLTQAFLNQFFDFPNKVDDNSVFLLVTGTDRPLKPETSRSFTFGFDLDHDFSFGHFKLSSSYVNINFKNRINNPVLPGGAEGFYNVINTYLTDPASLPTGILEVNPSQARVGQVISRALAESGMFNDFFGLYQGPDKVGYIVNYLTSNRGDTHFRSLDFDASLVSPLGSGNLGLTASASYILEFKQANEEGTPFISVVDTIYNPTHLRLRFGATWAKSGFGLSFFDSFTNGYSDNRFSPAAHISSWNVVDMNISYDIPSRGGILRGTKVQLGVQNLLDRAPPRLRTGDLTFLILGYDPTNASPIQRFVSLTLTKRW